MEEESNRSRVGSYQELLSKKQLTRFKYRASQFDISGVFFVRLRRTKKTPLHHFAWSLKADQFINQSMASAFHLYALPRQLAGWPRRSPWNPFHYTRVTRVLHRLRLSERCSLKGRCIQIARPARTA